MSYLQDRLAAYHITEADNTFRAEAEEPGRTVSFRFFTETDKGDIAINYLTPDGAVEYHQHGHVQTRRFSRIRYARPEEHKGSDGKPRKYQQEKGTETFPFVTPTVISAYRQGEPLKVLYVVEGEFKAFCIHMQGLPAVGIGGVQNFRDARKTRLHPYLTDIISRCRVQNLVLIYDRDCLQVEWKEGKDLAERPIMFYSALNTFNELLKPYDVQLYFCHVAERAGQKGIDDTLLANPDHREAILDELTSFTAGMPNRQWVMTYLVTGISSFRIMQIFAIDSVESFAERYRDVLQDREFRWKSNNYYFDEEGKPKVSWMQKATEYVRVGIDYYRRVAGIYGKNVEVNLEPWKATVIKTDYGPKFLSQVKKFDGFANIPENDPDLYHRAVHAGKDDIQSVLYNIYSPVSHRPAEGEWRTINRLVHHIFDYKNCAGVPMYEMALDYLQLIYLKPAQHLPILCLVSEEQATGKTTFLQLLKAIYAENMRILDSKRLSGNFNSHWAGKLIVATDEAFLDTEKKEVSNTLKMIATNDTVPMEGKGRNAVEVSNFAKLIMCSNDEKSFARIEAADTRYWVIRVQSIPRDERDPHMQAKMVREIPAFLHFLTTRKMYYPERTRLWFEVEDYDTPAHRAVQERTELGLVKHVKDVVKTQFFYQHCDKLRLSLAAVYELTAAQYKFADKQKIAEYLHDRGLTPSTATNFTVANEYHPDNWPKRKDRCYTFLASDWMTPDEIADMNRKEEDTAWPKDDSF